MARLRLTPAGEVSVGRSHARSAGTRASEGADGLIFRRGQRTVPRMSVAELQKNIAELPAGPRRSVAKFVAYLQRRDSPARRRLLADIGREMDAGKSYSQAEVDAALARRASRR